MAMADEETMAALRAGEYTDGITLDDMYAVDDPYSSLGRRPRRRKPQRLLGPEPQRLLGPDVPPRGVRTTGLGTEPPIVGTPIGPQNNIGGPAPAPAPVPAPTVSAPETGPAATEERYTTAWAHDPYRTSLLQFEGSNTVTDPDSGSMAHQPYKDADGWSVGYGHYLTDADLERYGLDPTNEEQMRNFRLPEGDARALLVEDSSRAKRDAIALLQQRGISPDGPLGDIVGLMVYQMGRSGTAKFEKMLAALKAGDNKTAAREMLNSKWAKQTPSRAQALAQQVASLPPQPAGGGLRA